MKLIQSHVRQHLDGCFVTEEACSVGREGSEHNWDEASVQRTNAIFLNQILNNRSGAQNSTCVGSRRGDLSCPVHMMYGLRTMPDGKTHTNKHTICQTVKQTQMNTNTKALHNSQS